VFGAESRIVDTPAAFNVVSTALARPSEYGSWKSMITTFLTLRVLIMKFASLGPWM
jgi:hypothetical protein